MPREKMPEQVRKPSPTSQDSGATTVSMSATEMSEDRSRGMYHSLIGKPSLRVVLVMGLLIGLCLLLLAACGGGNSANAGAHQEHKKSTSGDTASTNLQTGQEHKKSTSGGTASTDGLIVFFRRDAIFTMYPNGSHIRQITHPPKAGSTAPLHGPPMGRRSPSIAGVCGTHSGSARIAMGGGSWSSTSTPEIRARSHTAYLMGDGPRKIRLHHSVVIAWETSNPPSQPTVSR